MWPGGTAGGCAFFGGSPPGSHPPPSPIQPQVVERKGTEGRRKGVPAWHHLVRQPRWSPLVELGTWPIDRRHSWQTHLVPGHNLANSTVFILDFKRFSDSEPLSRHRMAPLGLPADTPRDVRGCELSWAQTWIRVLKHSLLLAKTHVKALAMGNPPLRKVKSSQNGPEGLASRPKRHIGSGLSASFQLRIELAPRDSTGISRQHSATSFAHVYSSHRYAVLYNLKSSHILYYI